MNVHVSTLTAYPILTLFLVTGLGYLLGEIDFFGFRLKVADVLFAGLASGSLSPNASAMGSRLKDGPNPVLSPQMRDCAGSRMGVSWKSPTPAVTISRCP